MQYVKYIKGMERVILLYAQYIKGMEVVILSYAQYTSRQEKESFYLLLLQCRLVTVVVCCMGS